MSGRRFDRSARQDIHSIRVAYIRHEDHAVSSRRVRGFALRERAKAGK